MYFSVLNTVFTKLGKSCSFSACKHRDVCLQTWIFALSQWINKIDKALRYTECLPCVQALCQDLPADPYILTQSSSVLVHVTGAELLSKARAQLLCCLSCRLSASFFCSVLLLHPARWQHSCGICVFPLAMGGKCI